MDRSFIGARGVATVLVALLVAACGGAAATPTPAPPTAPPSAAAPSASAAATAGSSGPASLEALDSVMAGVVITVTWAGPNGQGDYVTIVKAGTAAWSNEDYFYTNERNPGELTVPSTDGAYELWYISGADKTVLARRPLTVTPFVGTVTGPDSVVANTEFEVAWTGPNGPGDYVTIVKAGVPAWTNEDYFYTHEGSPGKLLAPLEAGAYELLYITGSDVIVHVRVPIAVTAASATVDGPDDVARGAQFEVSWTGPNGPGDFVTIVSKGAEPTAYLGYVYTSAGSPGTLTAPDEGGDYELRYVTGTGSVVLASVPIVVK